MYMPIVSVHSYVHGVFCPYASLNSPKTHSMMPKSKLLLNFSDGVPEALLEWFQLLLLQTRRLVSSEVVQSGPTH